MAHVAVLLWAVAFGVGITAVASTYQRYRLEPGSLLRHYWQFLLLSNLTVGGALLATYVATNIARLEPLAARRSSATLFLVASSWVVGAFVYQIVLVTRELVGQDLTGWVRRLAVSALVLAPFGVLAGLALGGHGGSYEKVFAWSEVLNISLVAAGMVALMAALVASGALAHGNYRQAVRRLCSLHLAAFALIPVAAWLRSVATWSLLIVSFVATNLAPLFLLGPLLAHRKASPLGEPERGGALESFGSRYGISEREQEIVRLLLRGCTNSEIGAALCISSHTVKNHVYSVYRKAGVRNRVGLSNLVRGL